MWVAKRPDGPYAILASVVQVPLIVIHKDAFLQHEHYLVYIPLVESEANGSDSVSLYEFLSFPLASIHVGHKEHLVKF